LRRKRKVDGMRMRTRCDISKGAHAHTDANLIHRTERSTDAASTIISFRAQRLWCLFARADLTEEGKIIQLFVVVNLFGLHDDALERLFWLEDETIGHLLERFDLCDDLCEKTKFTNVEHIRVVVKRRISLVCECESTQIVSFSSFVRSREREKKRLSIIGRKE